MSRLLTLFDPAAGALGGGASFLPFTDTFTDTDGVALSTHNANWADRTANTFEVLDNGIVGNGSVAVNIATVDAGVADVTIEVNLTYKSTSAHFVGIVGRYVDTNNYWYIAVSTTGNGFRIIERNGGSDTIRKFSNTLSTIGNSYLLSVTFSGATISATFQSVTIEYTSATFQQTETKFGLYSQNTSATNDSVNSRLLDFFVGAV